MRWHEIMEAISQEPALRYIAAAEKLVRDQFGGQIDLTLLDGSHDEGNFVTIVDIRSHEMQRGLGTKAMELLCALADQMHIVLELGVANDEDNMGPPGEAKLIEWYERFGFECEDPGFAQERVEMRRDPDRYVRKDAFAAWHAELGEAYRPALDDIRTRPVSYPEHLAGRELAHYIITTDDIDYSEHDDEDVDWDFVEGVYARYATATADLRYIPITGLEFNNGYIDRDNIVWYSSLETRYPPIIVEGNFIIEGNHRVTVLKERGETHVWAYVVRGALNEDGRIVKGVNTTCYVGVDEITRQAAKFGNKVSRDGVPAYRLR